VGAIDNTIAIGQRLNWSSDWLYPHGTYSYYNQTINNAAGTGPTFGITNPVPVHPRFLPSFTISEFETPVAGTPSMRVGPYSTFANTGYYRTA